jgi:hypothetical protein
MAMSKVLLEHYKGIRELNRDDLVFMFSHLFKDELEKITPRFPRFPNTQKEFWEWLVDKIVYEIPYPRIGWVLWVYVNMADVENGGFITIYLEFWNHKFPDNQIKIEDIDYEDFR